MSSYNNKKNYLIVFALIMLLCTQNSKKIGEFLLFLIDKMHNKWQ